jgi:outer membrane protein OmpA-like peptidoglycan-associated protein
MAAIPTNKKMARKPTEEPISGEAAAGASAPKQPAKGLDQNVQKESMGTNAGVSQQLKPGQLFAWFELQQELENGRTGAVWLAQDFSVKRPVEKVALKFLPDSVVRNKTAVEDLKSEISRRIPLRHPNILRVFAMVESKARVAIPMEHLDGQSLSRLRLTEPNQFFEVRDVEKWVQQLCEAVEYAHQEIGVVDGNIVPENLIIGPDGNLKLKEFGVSNCISDSMRRWEKALPEPGENILYQSPQQKAGEPPVRADDLFSLGAILYELLTGQPPLEVAEKGISSMTGRRAELGLKGEAIPKAWEDAVAACLASDPLQRPESAIELKNRLKIVSPPSDVPAATDTEIQVGSLGYFAFRLRPDAKPKGPRRTLPGRKLWGVIAGLIFILALALAIAFYSFHRTANSELGRIVVNTIPNQARVFLDGIPRGITPLVLEDIAPGNRQLRIELEGYEEKILVLPVSQGAQGSFQVIHLVPIGATTSSGMSPTSTPASKSSEANRIATPETTPEVRRAPTSQSAPTVSPEVSSAPAIQTSPSPLSELKPVPSSEPVSAASPEASLAPTPQTSPVPPSEAKPESSSEPVSAASPENSSAANPQTSPAPPLEEKPASTSQAIAAVSPENSPAATPEPTPVSSPEVTPSPSSEPVSAASPQVGSEPAREAVPAPSPQAEQTPSSEVGPTVSSSETARQSEKQSAGPSSISLSQADIDATKEEVIKRINALPGVAPEKKAILIENLHKARSMVRLTVIPFESGQANLRRAAVNELVNAFAKPEMRDKISDPTTILVVAGYADAGGRADLNLRVSRERAESVTKVLKEQANLLNAMQTIGMGGTDLLDSNRREQNRAVEVWAVVPW